MRVALVGDRPPPHGGISVHVEALAARLRAAGCQVELLDTARHRGYARFGARLASLVARGYLLHVHTSGHNPKSWALALAGAAARPGRNLLTLHSGLLPGYLAGAPLRQAVARRAVAGYGRVVAVSPPLRTALIGAGAPASRLEVLPAFSAGSVQPGPPPEGFAALRAERTPLFACALTPSPVYGAHVLFAALPLLARRRPGVAVAVFGPGSGELEREARAAGLAERVRFFGELEHARALGLIRGCDALLRPTLTDGDALSVREALALQVPVVASDACARPEGTFTFAAGDPFALAEAAELALEARPAWRAPAQPEASGRLLEIYAELAGRTAGRGAGGPWVRAGAQASPHDPTTPRPAVSPGQADQR